MNRNGGEGQGPDPRGGVATNCVFWQAVLTIRNAGIQ